MVLVDSSIWIAAASRRGPLEIKVSLEGLLKEYEAAFCGPVKLEVLGNCRKEQRKHLSHYFSVIPYLHGGEEVWEEAKLNAWKLRDTGEVLPWFDIVIATLAIRYGVRVYANDKHFEVMQRKMGILLYQPGYGGKFNPG